MSKQENRHQIGFPYKQSMNQTARYSISKFPIYKRLYLSPRVVPTRTSSVSVVVILAPLVWWRCDLQQPSVEGLGTETSTGHAIFSGEETPTDVFDFDDLPRRSDGAAFGRVSEYVKQIVACQRRGGAIACWLPSETRPSIDWRKEAMSSWPNTCRTRLTGDNLIRFPWIISQL